MINLNNGELVWSKSNSAPFNSQIKIFKDRFYNRFTNTLDLLKNGEELVFQTEKSLIRSQKNYL